MKTNSICSCITSLGKIKNFALIFVMYSISHSSLYASSGLETKLRNKLEKSNSSKSINTLKNPVHGVVTDEAGLPIPGATILVVGQKGGGAISDNDGIFTIAVSPGDVIQISYLGFTTQNIKYTNQKELTVKLQSEADELDSVTVVAFAKQKKESVVGAITTIKASELKIPSSNLTNSFAGRVPGMVSYQRSGEPGSNNSEFYIRGITTFGYRKEPLILIDNNEVTSQELARLSPDDIATFSIMKDATSTALYGSRGANGVILITTKEGREGPAQVSIRMEHASSSNTTNVAFADPVTYMNLHNEAVMTRNPLGIKPYSQEKINGTVPGANPNLYPANDWRNIMFRTNAPSSQVNVNVSGGGKAAQYYVAGNFSTDAGNLNVDQKNNFNNNISLKRYMLRSNVNINLTSSTQMKVRLQAAFDDYSGPIDGGTSLYYQTINTNPVLFPAYYAPDAANETTEHILFGNARKNGNDLYNNPYAAMTRGYRESTTSQISAQLELKQDLNFITDGLFIRGMFNTNHYSYFQTSREYKPFFYALASADPYTLESLNPTTGTEYLGYNQGGKDINSSTYFEAAISWNRTYSDKHSLGALLVGTARNQVNASAADLQLSLPYRNVGFAGRATYAYDSRYFIEANFGYNGSERFSEKERYGFFPSIGGGWLVSNEKFWMDNSIKDIVNKFKLKTTYGWSGNDAIGSANDRFFYLSNVNLNDGNNGAAFGTYGNSYYKDGVSISRYANDNITWENSQKLNLGLEFTLLKEFEFSADYFTEARSNILMDRAAIPSTMGLQTTVKANVGEASSRGFELSFNFNHNFSHGWWVAAQGNVTVAKSKFEVYEEPTYQDMPWKSRVGSSLSQQYGYIAERLFVDEEEVQNSPKQFGNYMAGDIKYKDINGDGQITDLDIVPIGGPHSPEVVYGFGISGGWKNIDVSTFFQGVGGTSVYIDAKGTAPFIDGQNALLKAYADNHWSEDNRNLYALYPRLSDTHVENNEVNSTWWLRDASFMRLKSIEIGYTLPKSITNKARLSKCRAYANGNNLLTFSQFKMWDPEMGGNGLGYPVQKVINFGIQVSF